jgi:hypothetical protein
MELSLILACISFSRVSCCSASWASFPRAPDGAHGARIRWRSVGNIGIRGIRGWFHNELWLIWNKRKTTIAGHSWARISMNFFPSVKSVQKLLTFPAVQGIATSKGLNWSCQTLGVKSHPDSQSQGKPGKALKLRKWDDSQVHFTNLKFLPMKFPCVTRFLRGQFSRLSPTFTNYNLLMWVKQCHKPSPSHHHVYRWYIWTTLSIIIPGKWLAKLHCLNHIINH